MKKNDEKIIDNEVLSNDLKGALKLDSFYETRKQTKMKAIIIGIISGVFIFLLIGIALMLVINSINNVKKEDNYKKATDPVLVEMEPRVENLILNTVNVNLDRAYGKIEIIWLDKENRQIDKPLKPILNDLIPVKYDKDNYKFVRTVDKDADWYDYDNKMWANAINKDNSYFVWIPRFAYKIIYYEDSSYKNISGLDNEEQFLGRINRSCKKSGKAYFFYLTDAKKVYKNSVIIENKLNLFSDEMRDVLENKNFDVFYSKVLEILKRKAKEKINNDNFETIIFNKKFRLLKERMQLIEEQDDKKTYFFNRTLTNEEIEEIGENIDGSEVWERYVDILKEENYAKKIVELSKIREKMMYFLYEVKKNVELNYSDIKGSIIYIDDGDKYFIDGVYTGGEGDMFI